MKPRKFKLALLQMEVRGSEKDWNLRHAVELIAEAAHEGAQVALLPECIDTGWTHPSCTTAADKIPGGGSCQSLMQAAREHSVYVCAGLTERSKGRVYNSAVLIDRDGKLLCKHRKLNELDIAHEYYAQGDRLRVVETEFGSFGLMICADGFAKDRVLSRALCYLGADVILSPGSWAVESDHDQEKEPYGDTWTTAYIPTAKEFSCAIFGVSNVGPITAGPWEGRKCIGCSLGIDSTGQVIARGPYGVDAECILYLDVDVTPRPARGTDWEGVLDQEQSE